MPRTYLPLHDTTVGIQLMGRMFEQQVRIAQAFGAAAMASNPFLTPPVRHPAPEARPAVDLHAGAAKLPQVASNQSGGNVIPRTARPRPAPLPPRTFARCRSMPV